MPTVRIEETVARVYEDEFPEHYFERDGDSGEIIDLTDEGRDHLFTQIGLSFWDDEDIIQTDYQFTEDD